VTPSDLPSFKDALHRLGRVMGRAVTEDLVEDYFQDLKEFEWPLVETALAEVRKTSRFWPRPSAIRAVCLRAPGAEPTTALPPWVNHTAERYYCDTCQDTGFERGLECDGAGGCHVGHCGREGYLNHPHGYTRACSCRATNPILVRDRERVRQRNQANREASV
jgi:hypothetical protein